jgi:tRNA-intron endonuclease
LTSPKPPKKEALSEEFGKIKAVLTERGIFVYSAKDVENLSSRGYGVLEEEKLKLFSYEALFLLSKEIIEIEDDKTGEKIDFQNLLQKAQTCEDENIWVKYLIYRDIRSRGYVAREGFGLGVDFRVYERGEYGKEAAKYLLLGIQEGKPVSVEELARALKYTQRLKKQLILAVINRRGEIVYYSLSQLTMK